MISKFTFFALVALYIYAPSISGEDCIPASVLTLRLAANAVLFWEVTPKEPCHIQGYQVDIVGDRQDEYRFVVTDLFVDVSFLEVCEEWHFVVRAISDGIRGYERRLVDYVPLPPNADLSLSYFNVTQVGRSLHLDWDLTTHTHGDCTLRYRITVEDEEQGEIHDTYVSGRSADLDIVSPCVSYQLRVRAVNRAYPTIEGPMRFTYHEMPPEPEEAPTLRAIEVGATSIDMSFNLENSGRNRCPVRTLYVDGGNNFNISIPLTNDEDRPPVDVALRGLYPNSMYFLKISVENSAGISRPAQLGVQTLELSPGSG
ncbi:uncharacterized protein LOC108910421 [Anoplophora glabripennis]|uniref:uncharacterized protein LOC108910421 n=1 Tax=Anoplophora glabripennis TaxID=217634 RepID=UPI000875192D|nr:uncharacterized protein LOC108910421 [Anoplophora glabripennis]